MKITVVSAERKLISDLEVQEIFVPSSQGELNILPGHAPLVTTLQEGDFRYRTKDGALKHLAISWGFCQVGPETVTVLAETAEMPEEIDLERIEKSRLKAEKMLLSENIDDFMRQKYSNKLRRIAARSEVAKFKN